MFINPRELPPFLRLSDQQLEQLITDKVSIMYDYFGESGFGQAVIGLSGGIDSAAALALAVRALGRGNVICLRLPYGPKPKDSYFRAEELIRWCDLPEDNLHTFNITDSVVHICWRFGIDITASDQKSKVRLGNIAARIRMLTLMDECTKRDALLIGTENLTEHHMAYFTIGGDEVSNYEPIKNLWKTQVFQLGAALGLPDSVLDCPPSAELWDGQTDEGEIGASYVEIDTVLAGVLEHDLSKHEICARYPVTPQQFHKVMQHYKRMKGKANSPFVSPK